MRLRSFQYMMVFGLALAATPSSAVTAESPPLLEEQAGRGNSKSDLVLPQDRQINQWLQAAQLSLEAKDFASAAMVLQRILQSDADPIVEAGTSWLPARQRALQLADQLPHENRAKWDAELDRSAQVAFQASRCQDSIDAAAQFAGRYPGSLEGLEALKLVAAMHHDMGRFEQAAAAWQIVSRHPRTTATQRTIVLTARIESLRLSGRLDLAEQVAGTPDWNVDDESILIAGRQVKPRQWVSSRLRANRQKSPSVALADPRGPLPALQSLWSRDVATAGALQGTVGQVQNYYRNQGIVSFPVVRPVVAGKAVLIRTMQDLLAFNVATGEPLWNVPNQEYARISRRPEALENDPFRTTTASDWFRRLESDSLFAAATSDQHLVVVIQEPDRSAQDSVLNRSQRVTTASPVVRWNKLCGYEVASGQLRWHIGGPPTGPSDVFGGVTFLGAPLFVDDVLFTVARNEDELSLLAIDRDTGHLRWTVKLGALAPHLADTASRRRIACPVTLVDGLLLCPTISGGLVAVNPVTRLVEWVYRYSVVQHTIPPRQVNGQSAALPDVWWNEWREVTCLATRSEQPSGGLAVFATPDSDQLTAIEISTAKAKWSIPRNGALHVAGLTETAVIVIEPMAARAHDLLTGRLLWRAPTGEISGRGVVTENHLIQPRRSGGFAVIQLEDGSQLPGLADSDVNVGTLIHCEQGWIGLDELTLSRFSDLKSVHQQALEAWKAMPNEATTLELARLDLQTGNLAAARIRLEGMESDAALELRRKLLQSELRKPADGTSLPAVREELSRELLEACRSDDERALALRTIGEAAWASGDLRQAMSTFLDGLDLIGSIGASSIGDWSAEATSNRSARPDRFLLGHLESLLNAAPSAEVRNELEQKLSQRLERARQSTDRFAAQRLIDNLLPLDWAQRTLLQDYTAVLYARSLEKVEPLLLSAAGSANREFAASALGQLAELQWQSGWKSDSESLQRRLLAEYPGIPLPNGQSRPSTLASEPDLAELRNRLLSAPRDLWPVTRPTVERDTKRHQDIYNVPVMVQAAPGSLFDQLEVSVDRTGATVRFASEGVSGIWECRLPGKPRPLRSAFANLDLVEAYGVGRLMVLRVGSEVFGILPFNELGEPMAKVTPLQLDISSANTELPAEAWWQQQPVAAKVGIRHEGTRLIDGFGRTMGGLGPVRPCYLCYRSQAKLVAVETQTGRRLWEHLDLPLNCRIFGDDDRVYLWKTEDATVQSLSAIDGRVLTTRAWNVSANDVLLVEGSRVWSVVRQPDQVSVRLSDARTGDSVWTESFEAGAIPFAMDSATIGVVDPRGLLHIHSAITGAARGEPLTIELPNRIERIVALRDRRRWYVAISAPVPRLANLMGDQLWGGLRLAFVNGWFYGIDQQNPHVNWRRRLESEPVPLIAPLTAPVLVQMWRQSNFDGSTNHAGVGTLRVLDTRTGQDILTHRDGSLQCYSALLPADTLDKLEIHTERETFRLVYPEASRISKPHETAEPDRERATEKD